MQVAKKLILDQLSPCYSREEIESISRLIFEKVLGLSAIQVHLNLNKTISAANLTQIKDILNRLIRFEPIQYILGETEFYGTKIKVNSAVLVPRQETEELADWIIKDFSKLTPNILDIGTGSGCIPIALVKNLPGATAVGWDISIDALAVAKDNAICNNVNIDFQYADILKSVYPSSTTSFDVIVSNPPYVTTLDQLSMNKNVLNYEPHIALFVADNDPLIFYRIISELAPSLLKSEGHIYFEINEKYGTEIMNLLTSKGFLNIILKRDINGRARMVRGRLPGKSDAQIV